MRLFALLLAIVAMLAVFMAFWPAFGRTVRDWELGHLRAVGFSGMLVRFLQNWLRLSVWCLIPSVPVSLLLILISF